MTKAIECADFFPRKTCIFFMKTHAIEIRRPPKTCIFTTKTKAMEAMEQILEDFRRFFDDSLAQMSRF